MKKVLAMVLAFCLIFALCAVNASAEDAKKYEGRRITVAHRYTGANADAVRAEFDKFEELTGCKIDVEVLAADADEAESVLLIRAATGNLPDVFSTNVGAKLWELDPESNMYDLSGNDWLENVNDGYLQITSRNGATYGIPAADSTVAGVFYNKAIFEQLNLEIPKTWDELLAICEILKNNGITPVEQIFGLANGRQFQFLMQYYYVQAEDPEFAAKYSRNEVALHENAAYVRGVEKVYDLWEKGYINEDPLSTSVEVAVNDFIENKYGMVFRNTSWYTAVNQISPEAAANLGFFPMPDIDPDNIGVTLWMPHAWVASQNSKNIDVVLDLFKFLTTQEAIDAYTSVLTPTGAFLLKDVTVNCELSDVIREAQACAAASSAPAMEYSCNIKGSNMATILSMVGTGEYTPEQGIEEIEMDNAIDAQQKGLEGW